MTSAKTRRGTRSAVSLPRRAALGGSCGTPRRRLLPADSGCAQRGRPKRRMPASPVTPAARRCPSCRPRRPDVAGARQWARAAPPPDNFLSRSTVGGGRPSLRAAPPSPFVPCPRPASRVPARSFFTGFFLLIFAFAFARAAACRRSLSALALPPPLREHRVGHPAADGTHRVVRVSVVGLAVGVMTSSGQGEVAAAGRYGSDRRRRRGWRLRGGGCGRRWGHGWQRRRQW